MGVEGVKALVRGVCRRRRARAAESGGTKRRAALRLAGAALEAALPTPLLATAFVLASLL